jgi:divalent metal cation (Fe/Co/Zn/Cd) transporter
MIRFGRYEVLAGLVNGVFLIFISFSIVIESIEVSSETDVFVLNRTLASFQSPRH